jgi:ubiquinol-cytochrome c reductase cytochrome b subunit
MFLHSTGSNKPLGVKRSTDKVFFHKYFTFKDLLGIIIALIIFLLFLENLEVFMEYQNFLQANPLVTPTHIQPE